MYKNYAAKSNAPERPSGKYKQKLNYVKCLVREYVHENAALVDELEDVQVQILIRKEERKFLLRKLCEYEPQVAAEVQNYARKTNLHQLPLTPTSSHSHSHQSHNDRRLKKKKHSGESSKTSDRKRDRSKKSIASKSKRKIVQPIPLDTSGRPLFPIDLNRLTIHSLGEVVYDRQEFHTEDVIYPVGFVSTRIYGSLKDPTVKCIYTCKISDGNPGPLFEIASDDSTSPIIGDTPDVCHSLLLQAINDVLSLHVVSTRPRGNDFFGLSHPIVLNLIQSSPGTRKCGNYKWTRFEVSKTGDTYNEGNEACLSYDYLQRSIQYCKYKMAPDILQKPPEHYLDTKKVHHEFY